jgi:hypothetical protein
MLAAANVVAFGSRRYDSRVCARGSTAGRSGRPPIFWGASQKSVFEVLSKGRAEFVSFSIVRPCHSLKDLGPSAPPNLRSA